MATAENGCVVASYNIHRCIGRDQQQDSQRVAAVVAEINADIIGLQEVESRNGAQDAAQQLDLIAQRTHYEHIAGVTIERPDSHYGNGLLTRLSVSSVRRHDLSVPGREPRGVLDVVVNAAGTGLRVLVTHLGLAWRERQSQAQIITSLANAEPDRPVVLLADFNEWLPWGPALRRINRCFGQTPALRTFPSRRPLFRLDRVWVQPREALRAMWVHGTPLARQASDHLPLVARLDFAASDIGAGHIENTSNQ